MGQRIWAVLEQYAGKWVALDKRGEVVDAAETLAELMRRAGEQDCSRTFVFAANPA